jgi:hypothetical protein
MTAGCRKQSSTRVLDVARSGSERVIGGLCGYGLEVLIGEQIESPSMGLRVTRREVAEDVVGLVS